MNKVEQSLTQELEREDQVDFVTTDEEFVKRAVTTISVQQGSKDLISLGMASIWVVFTSIFTRVLKPTVNNMANDSRNK